MLLKLRAKKHPGTFVIRDRQQKYVLKQIQDVLNVNHLAKKRMYDRSHWRYSLGDFNASEDAI